MLSKHHSIQNSNHPQDMWKKAYLSEIFHFLCYIILINNHAHIILEGNLKLKKKKINPTKCII